MDNFARPVIIVEDDSDDLEVIMEAYAELALPNKLVILRSGKELETYLSREEAPLLILSDYHLPQFNGIELRARLLKKEQLRYKSVPFLLWSTSVDLPFLKSAYDTQVHGFFVKPNSFEGFRHTLSIIITYWHLSQHPKEIWKI